MYAHILFSNSIQVGIYYATETGTAARFARDLRDTLRNHANPELKNLKDLSVAQVASYSRKI